MRDLSSKEKAELRGVAQRLKPAVFVGKKGITEEVAAEISKSLRAERLIKVGFNAHRDELPGLASEIEKQCDCVSVGGVGKKRSFYREAD